jgi:16S rRNA (cytosine967-C5)-methyltransferase
MTPIRSRQNAQGIAADVILRWLKTGDFPERLIPGHCPDRPTVLELVMGTVRRKRTLEWLIGQCSARPPTPDIAAFLMIGAYQVFFMSGIPAHAIVNETVLAAKTAAGQKRAGFVNAVLRRLIREQATFTRELAIQSLGVRASHPDRLIRRWSLQFGQSGAEALALWNNQPPPVAVAVNTMRTTPAALDTLWQAAGIDTGATPATWPADYRLVPRGCRVTELPGFETGLFFVQDPATDLAVQFLDAHPGQTILDACAAPGGKTMRLATGIGNAGRIIALDPHADRLQTLRANIARLQLDAVGIVHGDATDTAALTHLAGAKGFDRILLDAPCTNTGVLRRRPDARWRFTADRLAQVCLLQQKLLRATATVLRPGGLLVYSTCSLEPEENRNQVERFLTDHADFNMLKERLLLPPENESDGAYACALARAC